MSTPRKVLRKRWHQPAYGDGLTRAYLATAEHALLMCSAGRDRPESEAISEALRATMRAVKIIQKRVETRT